MTAREMIIRLKAALQKGDSRAYENLRIPELDLALNESVNTLIKFIAQPRIAKDFGFEVNGRSIHDLRTIIRYNSSTPVLQSDGRTAIMSLPSDYLFYVKCQTRIVKGTCSKYVTATYIQHDDDELSPMYVSSFDWEVVNMRLDNSGIRFYHEGNFIVSQADLTYLKTPAYIHNAQDYGAGTYTTPAGVVLTGSQDCELPEHLHTEVVRLAALIVSGDIQMPDVQVKQMNYNLSIQ